MKNNKPDPLLTEITKPGLLWRLEPVKDKTRKDRKGKRRCYYCTAYRPAGYWPVAKASRPDQWGYCKRCVDRLEDRLTLKTHMWEESQKRWRPKIECKELQTVWETKRSAAIKENWEKFKLWLLKWN